MSLQLLTNHLHSLANPRKAKDLQWFFKTGPGEYGEGDQFIGIVVPQLRLAVKMYWDTIDLADVQELLKSPIHEFRLVGLLILVKKFSQSNQKEIYNFYLKNTQYINNWDLVDLSCHHIVGEYLLDKPRDILYKLANSPSLWERRISVISTFNFIVNHDFADSLKIAKILLNDKHDLIHKAVGWMLREIGKRDLPTLINFLDDYTLKMPRTTLRYAIEKLPESQRQHYLKLK